jgi:enamine deaminase RidA (YjgF/YER057c/UK114 family)
VLSLIRAGALPMEGAQVVMEGIVGAKKEVNPGGLAFISAYPATADDPVAPVAPLATKTLASLRQAVKAAGAEASDVLRVTCFLSSLEDFAATRGLVEAEYPRAALNYIQTQRAPVQAVAACEAVARLRPGGGARLRFIDPAGLPHEPGMSGVALVTAPHVVLTGTQVSFGYQERDARLAFERLSKSLENAGASLKDVAFAHYYPLSGGIAAQVRKIRGEFFDAEHPPAGTLLTFEGLPSMDAGFAVDVVAAKD